MSSGRSIGVKGFRHTPDSGGVTEVVIVRPERTIGSWSAGGDFIS